MRIDILTLFPEMFAGFLEHSIVARARAANRVDVRLVQWRDFATDKHRMADDAPYGGGAGMVLLIEPLWRAIEALRPADERPPETQVVYLTPQGVPFTQAIACDLAREARHLILVCGHYEGVDQRARDALFDREISIGDYVLTGGELPAAIVADAVARLVPGVLGNEESAEHESFMKGIFDHPHYTRPEDFRGDESAGDSPERPPREDSRVAPAPRARTNAQGPARSDREGGPDACGTRVGKRRKRDEGRGMKEERREMKDGISQLATQNSEPSTIHCSLLTDPCSLEKMETRWTPIN